MTRYRSDALVAVHSGMAQKAIEQRKWKLAESHLVRSNQWKQAIDMYREQQLWSVYNFDTRLSFRHATPDGRLRHFFVQG